MRKQIILIITLVLAFLMPYLSRVPGMTTYGSDWLWSYIGGISGFLFFGAFNLISIVPLLVVGLFFIFEKVRISFALTALVHLLATYYLHHDYDLAADAQAAIGLIFIPIIILVITLPVALVSSVIEWSIYRCRVKN